MGWYRGWTAYISISEDEEPQLVCFYNKFAQDGSGYEETWYNSNFQYLS